MISVRNRTILVVLATLGALYVSPFVSPHGFLYPVSFDDISVALAFLSVLLVIQFFDVDLPFGTGAFTITVNAPVICATTIRFGALEGSLIVLIALLAVELKQRVELTKAAANVGVFMLSTVTSAIVYHLIAETSVSPLGSVQNVAALIAMGATIAVVGNFALGWIASPAIALSPWRFFQQNRMAVMIEAVSVPALGGLIAVLAAENALAVLLLLIPLLAPQIAYRTLRRAQQNIKETIESLADAIEKRDRYTANHSSRVARYSRAILSELPDIPDQLAQTILAAARVHDVGKVGIKDATLLKPGPLTNEERLDLQMHTVVGAEIVSRITDYRLCASIIRHHHERWDGAGYPDGLSGEDIPIGARIICVADAFDAMTSDRPYRRAMSAEAAIEEIRRNSGSQFDPRVVSAFESVMSFAPRVKEPSPAPATPAPDPQVTAALAN